MKKVAVFLLAIVMLVSLFACGKKENTEDPVKTPENDSAEATGTIETPLWTLKYDDTQWVYDEEYFTDDEDYCEVTLQVLDPEDSETYLINVNIQASVDDPYDFREDLVYYGFDQYEYAVNDAYALTEIGGVDCLKYETESWGEYVVKYFNRVEAAGATVCVEVDAGDMEDERIGALLEGLTFNLEETGNEDGPWEWEGEAFSAQDHAFGVGAYSFNSEWIPIDEYISTFETFNHAVAAVGDTVYLLTDGVLKQYAYDGESLTYEKDIELDEDDYEYIQSTSDGSIWLSGSLNDVVNIKDGTVSATYEDLDNIAMHPSGAWGISWFSSNECRKISFSDGTFTEAPMTFGEVDTIMHLVVDENNIYVCGSAVDESGHKVFIYNADGTLKTTLCDEEGEGLGSITYITETANGYIGMDGNMREVLLWQVDGTFIGKAEDSELFETYYPWFCSSTKLSDGSILTVMTEERADKSAMELIAFAIKGF